MALKNFIMFLIVFLNSFVVLGSTEQDEIAIYEKNTGSLLSEPLEIYDNVDFKGTSSYVIADNKIKIGNDVD